MMAPAPDTQYPQFDRAILMSSAEPCAALRLHHGQQVIWHAYVGVTGNLVQRVWVHRDAIVASFTRRYGVHRLVYYEAHDLITDAMRREHNISTGRAGGRWS
jgi:hypothetical protein